MKLNQQSNEYPFLSQAGGFNRHRELRVWMMLHDVTLSQLARAMGITPSAASVALKKERIGVYKYNVLVEFGIPSHLLPKAEDVRRGPKPR